MTSRFSVLFWVDVPAISQEMTQTADAQPLAFWVFSGLWDFEKNPEL